MGKLSESSAPMPRTARQKKPALSRKVPTEHDLERGAVTPSSPFQLRQALGWRLSSFTSAVWSPDGQHIAAGSGDTCIYIWNADTGELEHLLEGHQDLLWSVAWSPDGRLLASGANDKTVRVWSTDTWTETKPDTQASPKYFLLNISFCALTTAASIFGDEDIVLRAWETTPDGLLEVAAAPTSVHSTSAKIVFVGESNVGKSCLALRLAEDRYEEQGSTLGMKLWTLRPEQLDPNVTTPSGEKRDVTLWDLGGQDEYRSLDGRGPG